MLDYLEGNNYPGKVDYYSYDVACRLISYLRNRDPELHSKAGPKLVLGYFHSKSHKCQWWNVGYSKLGSGYNDGEQGERLNSLMVKYTAFLRYMREEHMQEAMEDFLMGFTRHANSNLAQVLHSKLKSCMAHLFASHSTFVKLCRELEDHLSQQGFSLMDEDLQQWVEAHTSPPPVANINTVNITGTRAEQEYVWASYEWGKIGADHEEAAAALREINQLGEPLEHCLVYKKKYLLTVVMAYEQMTKKRDMVSKLEVLSPGFWYHMY
jgi:HPt (histidine-containing phosphotransfer) domain-containing protein